MKVLGVALKAIALVVGLAVHLVAAPLPQARQWPLAPVDGVNCRVKDVTDPIPDLALTGSPTVSIACQAAGTIACSGPGLEPIDVDIASACSRSKLEMQPAKTIHVRTARPFEGTVEWLTLDDDLNLRTLAKRHVVFSEDTPIPVGRLRTNGWLRLSTDAASPATYETAKLPDDAAISFVPEYGGEGIVAVASAEVRPVRLRILGPSLADVGITTSFLTAKPGLQVGAYSVTPYFEGEISGPPVQFSVSAGQSAVAKIPVRAVGGVQLSVDSDLCTRAKAVVLSHVIENSSSVVRRIDEVASCAWRIGGLEPGRYAMTVEGADGSLARADAHVEPQKWTTAQLSNAAVTVSGRILINGKPPAGPASLNFSGANAAVVARPDANGNYQARLPLAGTYSVQFRSLPFLASQDTARRFEEGANQFDWEIEGGSIDVEISGWHDQFPIQLIVNGPTRTAGIVTRADLPESEKSVTLAGLAFGDYQVSATSPSGRVSKLPQSVTLSKSSTRARVTLEMIESNGELMLWNSGRLPVSGARILAAGRRLNETAAGTYSTKGVAPGTPMTIVATGLVPTCVLATGNMTSEVVLADPQVSVQLVFSKKLSFPPGVVVGVPGASCPVGMNNFGWTVASTSDTTTTINIVGLPPLETLSYDPGGSPQRLVPGGDGKIVVR